VTVAAEKIIATESGYNGIAVFGESSEVDSEIMAVIHKSAGEHITTISNPAITDSTGEMMLMLTLISLQVALLTSFTLMPQSRTAGGICISAGTGRASSQTPP
jgi:hypothetical protein